MNRVIKFRAWNPDDNKMEYPIVLGVCTNGILQPLIKCSDGNRAYKDYPLMQFTGLLDKNGKEIYEGDIVKYHTAVRETHVVACIAFETQAGAYWAKWSEVVDGRAINRYKELTATFGDGETFQCDIYEIIGNIYETSNLLTN